jgi:hypothetical protein
MSEISISVIETELARIGADSGSVGVWNSIGVSDEQAGWLSLGASEPRRDFYWYGRSEEMLERLRSIGTGAGPDAVRREFYVDLPPLGASAAHP